MAVGKFDFTARAAAGQAANHTAATITAMLQRNLSTNETPELMILPLERLHSYPEQERFSIDPQKVDDLAESISRVGLLQPLVVRALPGDIYQILAGHTRKLALAKAGKSEASCLVRRQCSENDARLIFYWSNVTQREIKPSERAHAYAAIADILGGENTTSQLVELTGSSRRTVQRYCSLANLEPELLDMVDNGTLSLVNGARLSRLAPQVQAETARLAAQRCGGKLDENQIRRLIDAHPSFGIEVNALLFPKREPRQKSQDLKLPHLRFGRYFEGLTKKAALDKIEAALEIYESAYKEEHHNAVTPPEYNRI